jgi:hypothetical protein
LSQSLEPDRTSLERPENSCAATLPIQADREEWEKLPKYRCARLVALRLYGANGASTKY